MPNGPKVVGALLASVVIAAGMTSVAVGRCEWGTFAYRAWLPLPGDVPEGPAAVLLVDGEERVLFETTPDGDEAIIPGEMALSPDGQEVVFEKLRTTLDNEYAVPESLGLYVYDVDGGAVREISDDGGFKLDWSPDGTSIVLMSGLTIGTIDPDGGNEEIIFRMPPSDLADPPTIGDVAWSGDSERIAFAIQHHGGARPTAEIWSMRSDGTDRRLEVKVGESFGTPIVWSPNGGHFAFGGLWEGVDSVILAEAADGKLSQVEPHSEYPVWSNDGNRLAYLIAHEGHYAPRIVVGDARGRGEEAVPVPDDWKGVERLDDWASC
jgi:Tol biopolymer transport system component